MVKMPNNLPFAKDAKIKRSTIEWRGLDRRSMIPENCFSATENLSTKNFPLISPRDPREVSYTLTSGKALFASSQLARVDDVTFTSPVNDITFGAHTISSAGSKFSGISVGDTLVITGCTVNAANNQTVIVTTATAAMITCSASTFTTTSGTPAGRETAAITFTSCSFKYNNVSKGPVTSGAKSMVELSQWIVIFPDKKSYDTVGNTFAAFGSGNWYATPIPAGSVPDIQYACTLDNRIWGVDNKDNICCTALGDFDDWTSFLNPDGSVNDAGAWSVDTGTNGGFTGIASYKGYNLVFKLDRVFRRFGEVPSNFQYVELSRLGCVSHKSIWEVNGILFWLSPQGVVAFTGGVPEIIGEELNDSYVSAVAGGDDRRYYISLYDGSGYKLYVYDTWKRVWLQEDDMNVKDFAYFGGSLYALASDNKINKFGSGTEKVSWEAVTKQFDEQIMEKKGHSELMMRVDLEAGSSLNVYVKTDNDSFKLVKSYSVSDISSFRVPLKIQDADRFQIKLVGSGEGTVHQLTREFSIEGE